MLQFCSVPRIFFLNATDLPPRFLARDTGRGLKRGNDFFRSLCDFQPGESHLRLLRFLSPLAGTRSRFR